jgi:protease-4
MDKAQVRELATGEVYTARRALEHGLIDELGDLERAIDLAAELGEVPRRPVWMRPRRGLRDLLSANMASAFMDEIAARVEERFATRYNFQ